MRDKSGRFFLSTKNSLRLGIRTDSSTLTWGIGVFGQNVHKTQGQVMELKAEKACDLVRMKAGEKKNA